MVWAMGCEVGTAASVESEMGYLEKASHLRATMLKRQGVCGRTGPSWYWPNSFGQNPWGGVGWIGWVANPLAALLNEISHCQTRQTAWTFSFPRVLSPCPQHPRHRMHFSSVQCADHLVLYLAELRALQRLLEQEEFCFNFQTILLILTVKFIVSFKQFKIDFEKYTSLFSLSV